MCKHTGNGEPSVLKLSRTAKDNTAAAEAAAAAALECDDTLDDRRVARISRILTCMDVCIRYMSPATTQMHVSAHLSAFVLRTPGTTSGPWGTPKRL